MNKLYYKITKALNVIYKVLYWIAIGLLIIDMFYNKKAVLQTLDVLLIINLTNMERIRKIERKTYKK